MYSEWESLTEGIQTGQDPNNVLATFPSAVGKDVVTAVLKPLSDLGNTSHATSPSPFSTAQQVKWTMQVIGYGLTLPLNEQSLIASCIDIYDTWLSALITTKKGSIPTPVMDDPDYYAQIMFEQLSQLFMPRKTEAHSHSATSSSGGASLYHSTNLHNHAVLCNRAIQITHNVVRNGHNRFSRETWQSLFKYLLKIVHTLLSPPPEPHSLGVTLCTSLMHVLFEAWLCACINCFPSPSLWKTLRELFANWRHHKLVVEQWNKVVYSLTLCVIKLLYGPSYLGGVKQTLDKEDKDFKTIIEGMPQDVLVQSWFRMLHTIGNPVEVSYVGKVLGSPAFEEALSEFELSKPKHKAHSPIQTCLTDLPKIFQAVMSGVAKLVYLFLAQKMPIRMVKKVEVHHPSRTAQGSPIVRKIRDELKQANRQSQSTWYVSSVSPAGWSSAPSTPSTTPRAVTVPMFGEVGQPRGNTLLHLFGEWLFEASIWPSEEKEAKKLSHGTSEHSRSISHDLVNISDYEEGRAEALGALCSIFTSQQCGEPFLPIYLARFYHALVVGLQCNQGVCHGQMLTKIILNSRGLLRKDMKSINVVVPHLIKALEHILPPKQISIKCSVDSVELRHCSIDLLLSMLCLPLHFLDQTLPDLSKVIPDLCTPPTPSQRGSVPPQGDSAHEDTDGPPLTFISLKDQLLHVLLMAIESERDPINIQMLLHGLMTFLQDIVCYENAVSKMISAEPADISEVLAVNQSPRPLCSIRSDSSVQSQITLSPTVYSTSSLFKQAISSGHYCLEEFGGTNVQVALAALELLAGLADLQTEDIDRSDCQQLVLLVCKFIQRQAMKDRPQHNKDLHTSIVAALNTLLRWISAHPYLLGYKESLTAIMEVVELGVSGTVSSTSNGEKVYKGNKEMKPVSGRVKEMAEYILYCVMEKAGAFPSPCGAEALSSLLSEEDILSKLPPKTKENAKFQYFVMDNSLVLGLLEGSFQEGETTPLPTVTAVIRSLTGRHAWSMQLRTNPRSEQVSTEHMHSKPRPSPVTPNPILSTEMKRRPWPVSVDEEPLIKIDKSIPVLEEVLDEQSQSLHDTIATLTQQQIEQEVKIHTEALLEHEGLPYPDPKMALEPTRVQECVNTARLLLNHIGMLSMESVQERPDSQQSSLTMLESSPSLLNNLCTLDRLPSRFCNTVFVLYLKERLTKPEDILLTQKLIDKPPEYIEFLRGLGWIVDPVTHPGFSGRIREAKSSHQSRPIGLSAQIPLTPFPYYADAISEMAFIIPTLKPSTNGSAVSLRSTESSDSGQETSSLSNHPLPSQGESISSIQPPTRDTQGSGVSESAVIAEISSSTGPKRGSKPDVATLDTPRSRRGALPQDCAAIVVWLEKFEDYHKFPLEALSGIFHSIAFSGSQKFAKKELPVMFIHKLSSGLYQIVAKSPGSRPDSMAVPLIDGMVVSRRSLSVLVRQTTLNMCQRRRMETEGYYPPHVKRKRKIEELAANFGLKVPVADFYCKLFSQKDTIN